MLREWPARFGSQGFLIRSLADFCFRARSGDGRAQVNAAVAADLCPHALLSSAKDQRHSNVGGGMKAYVRHFST